MKKKKLLVAPIALCLGFTLAACGNNTPTPSTTVEPTPSTQVTPSVDYDALLRNLNIDQNGKTVDKDFELAANLKSGDAVYPLTWTSSDESAVKIVVSKDGKVTAGVILPTAAKTVTLTAKIAEGKTKEFKVKVLPVDVYSFLNYNFELASGIYAEQDVKMDTTYELEHKSVALSEPQKFTANVSFTCEDQLITVDNTNHKFVIGSTEEKKIVKVRATFTYGEGEDNTTFKDYNVMVWHKLTPTEQFYYFYDTVGEAKLDLYGYVVSKAGYNESYGNGYLNIMDQTKLGGYYVYRAVIAKDKWDTLEVGTRVHISGAASTLYNGLIETNGSTPCEIVTDDAKLAPLTADELAALKAGTAVDDLVVGAEELKYQTGNMVKLTGWKVKEIGTANATTAGTLVTLTNKELGDDFEFTVQVQKYSLDLAATNATAVAIAGRIAAQEIKVGDIVDVKGVLYNYNGYNICAVTEDWISKSTATEGASLEAAKKLAAAAKVLLEKIPVAVTAETTIDLSKITSSGVKFEFELDKAYKTATLTENSLKFVPTTTAESVQINVTMTIDGLTYKAPYVVVTKILNDEEQVVADLYKIFEAEANVPVTYTLPAAGPLYESAFTWTLVDGADIATLENGVLTINPTAEAKVVKVGYTATHGNYEAPENSVYEIEAQYNPTSFATILSDKDTENVYVIEAVVAALNRPGSSGVSAVLVDKDGGVMFSYDGFAAASNVEVGDKVIVMGKYAENNKTPQLAKVNSTDKNITLVKVLSKNNDVAALLGTPTAVDAATAAPAIKNFESFDAVAEEYASKYLCITGHVVKVGTFTNLYGTATPATTDSKYNVMANDSLGYNMYAGKQVKVYGVFRGTSSSSGAWNKDYVTIQAIKIELVGETPTNETTYLSATTAEIQLKAEGKAETSVTVSKTPWTTGDVTWTVASADATKATVAFDDTTGKITITGKAATDSVKVTVTPSIGAAVEIDVKVKAIPVAGNPSFVVSDDTKGTNNSYTGNCDIEINGYTWNVTGNSTMTPWRIGGKSLTNTDRTLYSKTDIKSSVTKVKLVVGKANDITVNSIKLIVASDSSFNNVVSEVTGTFAVDSEISFDKPTDKTWTNCYYKFVLNVTVSGSSNKFVEVKGVTFTVA